MFRSRTGLLRTRDGVGRSVAGRPMYDWWFSREKSILIVSSWMCQNSPRRKAIGEDPMFVGCGVGDGERWRKLEGKLIRQCLRLSCLSIRSVSPTVILGSMLPSSYNNR